MPPPLATLREPFERGGRRPGRRSVGRDASARVAVLSRSHRYAQGSRRRASSTSLVSRGDNQQDGRWVARPAQTCATAA